jgi:hypothetical protein
MLPVSGAEQLNASGAQGERPMTLMDNFGNKAARAEIAMIKVQEGGAERCCSQALRDIR